MNNRLHFVSFFFLFILICSAFITLVGNRTDAVIDIGISDDALELYLDKMGDQFFTKNEGQWNSEIEFIGTTSFGQIGFTTSSFLLDIENEDGSGYVIKYDFPGSNKVDPVGTEMMDHPTNYFIGNDPNKWATDVASFKTIIYPDIWEGIDLVFKQDQSGLKYEFIVHADSNPEKIKIRVKGHESMKIVEGSVVLKLPNEILLHDRDLKSFYQNGVKEELDCRFIKLSNDVYTIELGDYDKTRDVVIDPLMYSTFLGGTLWDRSFDLVVDSSGNAYVTGFCYTGFPTTIGAYDTTHNGARDVVVVKLNYSGASLDYSTYVGGSSDDDGYGIDIDPSGNAYVTGYTRSSNFPMTTGAQDTSFSGTNEGFIFKLNPNGNGLSYSSYIGGSSSDYGYGIQIHGSSSAYITGYTHSSDFYTSVGAYDRTYSDWGDAFIMKISTSTGAISFSTFIGGSGKDVSNEIAVDKSGNAYIAGNTNSTNFPTTTGANDTSLGGNQDGFIAKLSSTGSSLVYSTYFGGSSREYIQGIALDGSGNATVAGYTDSTDLYTTSGAYSTAKSGSQDGFITNFNRTGGSIHYSTYIGGAGNDYIRDLDFDLEGNIWISGYTASNDFPMVSFSDYSTNSGGYDAVVINFNDNASSILYSTYLGGSVNDYSEGIEVDQYGMVYTTGRVDSTNYPTTTGAYDTSFNGMEDWGVTKITVDYIPDPPTGMNATVGYDNIFLNWTLPISDGGASIIGYNIYRGTSSTNIPLKYSFHPENIFTDTNVTIGVKYYYLVTAVNVIGESNASNMATADDIVDPVFQEYDNITESRTGEIITINASVTDDVKLITVKLLHRQGSPSFGSLDLLTEDGINWSTPLLIHQDLNSVYYYLEATDAYQNTNKTEVMEIDVLDKERPRIINDLTGDLASTGDPFMMRVRVGDNIDIASVHLEYKIGNDELLNITMSEGSDNKWTHNLIMPSDPTGSLFYSFIVVDTSGNWNGSLEKSVIIMDNDRPIFKEMDPILSTSTGSSIQLSVEVLDNVEVENVHLEYWFGEEEHQNVTLEGAASYTYTINIPNNSTSTLHYFFYGVDTSGNSNGTYTRQVEVLDLEPPQLHEDMSPDEASTGEIIEIRISASDNIEIESAMVEIWFGTSKHMNLSMTNDGSGEYSRKLLIPSDSVDPLSYKLSIMDTSENWFTGNIAEITVLDDLVPLINLTGYFQHLETGGIYEFYFEVWDNIGIKHVELEYWFGSGEHQKDFLTSESDIFTKEISLPLDEAGPLNYKITAFDLSDNQNSSQIIELQIDDVTLPEITPIEDINAFVDEEIEIAIEASDNIEIKRITLQGSPFELEGNMIKGVLTEVTTYTVIIRAFDTSENQNQTEFLIIVNPKPLDADEDGLPDEFELAKGLSPEDPNDAAEDPDDDNLTNLQEWEIGTDLFIADTDGDGLDDGYEVENGLDPLVKDLIESPDDDDDDGGGFGLILIIIVVILIFMALLGSGLFLFLRSRRDKEEENRNEADDLPKDENGSST